MGQHSKTAAWAQGTLWVVLNALGWWIILPVSIGAVWLGPHWPDSFIHSGPQGGSLSVSAVAEVTAAAAIAGVCWGAIMGVLQALVLRRRLGLSGRRWAGFTLLGCIAYQVAGPLLSLPALDTGLSPVILALVAVSATLASSLALGTAQWLALKRDVRRSGWWIAVVVLSLLAAAFAPSLWARGREVPDASLDYLVHGFLYGAATWIALIVLSRPPTKLEKKNPPGAAPAI